MKPHGEEMTIETKHPEFRISVEYRPGGHGRMGKVYHIAIPVTAEKIALSRKAAVKMAKSILKIEREGK